ncbi:Hypothetical protein SCF082_LOCUS23667 [Durusdinium trenchii]|uniref:Uncharacterized protein n=1 Tax=Durusdinium trenchii TaxID=1381693 RepID=A0ABP0LPA7_9DINO
MLAGEDGIQLAEGARTGAAGSEMGLDLKDDETSVRNATLRKWNIGMAVLHFIVFVVLLGAAVSVDSFKDFKLPLVLSFQKLEDAGTGDEFLTTSQRVIGRVRVGLMVPFFSLMSSMAHTYMAIRFDQYISMVNKGYNAIRWVEYSFSSTLMIWIIAMFFGIVDIMTLCLLSALNASMIFFGHVFEQDNYARTEGQPVKWLNFWFGSFCGAWPWIAIFTSFLGSGETVDIPGFVYGILVTYLIFFNCFALNSFLGARRKGPWKNYRYTELIYMVLSLVAKATLSFIVFGGLNSPNEFN